MKNEGEAKQSNLTSNIQITFTWKENNYNKRWEPRRNNKTRYLQTTLVGATCFGHVNKNNPVSAIKWKSCWGALKAFQIIFFASLYPTLRENAFTRNFVIRQTQGQSWSVPRNYTQPSSSPLWNRSIFLLHNGAGSHQFSKKYLWRWTTSKEKVTLFQASINIVVPFFAWVRCHRLLFYEPCFPLASLKSHFHPSVASRTCEHFIRR